MPKNWSAPDDSHTSDSPVTRHERWVGHRRRAVDEPEKAGPVLERTVINGHLAGWRSVGDPATCLLIIDEGARSPVARAV